MSPTPIHTRLRNLPSGERERGRETERMGRACDVWEGRCVLRGKWAFEEKKELISDIWQKRGLDIWQKWGV